MHHCTIHFSLLFPSPLRYFICWEDAEGTQGRSVTPEGGGLKSHQLQLAPPPVCPRVDSPLRVITGSQSPS